MGILGMSQPGACHALSMQDAFYQQGIEKAQRNDYQGAIADFSQALQLEPENAIICFGRALAYLATGNLPAALQDASQAIRLNPHYAAAYSLRGTTCQRLGETSAAIANYKKAAELYLAEKDAARCRQCLDSIQKLQAAEAQKAQSARPPLIPIELAEVLQAALEKAQNSYYADAWEDMDWLLRLHPQEPQVYWHRALILAEMQDWPSAIAEAQQAAQLFAQQQDEAMHQEVLERLKRFKLLQASSVRISQTNIIDFRARANQRNAWDTLDRLSPALRRKLFRLVGDDRKIAIDLVEQLKLKHPGMSEDWYWEKAIYDLERDRWR
ncbi:MAG TPA: tetratricopeptide repeat protein [Allocoleopsis sp.]